MIKVSNLSYSYPIHETNLQEGTDFSPIQKEKALNNVSFHIKEGEWIAIVGHNGSGKSTLSKLIDGLLKADSGDIVVDGLVMNEETVWDIRSKIGIVFQNPDNQFVGSTVEDDVAFGLENQGVPREEMIIRVDESLELVGMKEFKKKQPSNLSGGQKQRVAIAGVLALKSKIIILDEATSMLDPKGRLSVIEIVKSLKEKFNLTVISITHDIEEAKLADRIFVMNKGELLSQKPPKETFELMNIESLGLELPFSEKLRRSLVNEQIAVGKSYMELDDLEEKLCQLYLSK